MNKEKNIVIIGNGFDLMHDLDTSFKSFVKTTFDDHDKYILEKIRREAIIFRIKMLTKLKSQKNQENLIKKIDDYTTQIQGGDDWYDLETILRDSMFYEYQYIDDKYDKDGKKKTLSYDKIIDQWREKLRKYLKEQENDRKFEKVDKILQNADNILTFNYTDTLEKNYDVPSEKINYFHGSIDEEFVFGYSPDKIPRSNGRNLDKLNENDDYQYESVNLSSAFKYENPEEINIEMISPMKAVQRFILWAKRSEQYKNLLKEELIEIFFPDVNNSDKGYRYFLESINNAFMMENPFEIKPRTLNYNLVETSDQITNNNIEELKSKLKKDNRNLDILDAYFKDKQSLNFDNGDNVTITIIGHDYASDGDIKMFITEAVNPNSIKRIDYYYYISEENDGSVNDSEKQKKMREKLSKQFDVDGGIIRTINLNSLI
ncbi:bacteriophage abortive infection AbiH family protein [Fructilactobacillus ixorae]|uniref:Bacteriophage abortive infection AbiH family protein n=1 Tax=Fructilactobacillus ixorae TaxID=1750535 RepID=A0ABY5C6L5_9LACO|nr:AbiH family protein [Fructilactobacillus ixorae]USS92941.1 bacteriophage abortive infection AbiH family protein [Fructilactobacillus ixorae]